MSKRHLRRVWGPSLLATLLSSSGVAWAQEAATPAMAASAAPADRLPAMPPRYTLLPQEGMPAEMREAIAAAAQMLERFLSDRTLKYLQLEQALRTANQATDALFMQQPEEALKRLQAVSEWRALDEIPHMDFLARLSAVHGRLGNVAEQREQRLKLFGLQQAIGAKGDALSLQTAIEVPFIATEYDWLSSRRLRRERQSLVHQDGKSYDVLDVVDEQGNRSKRYFDVTRLVAQRIASIGAKP